MSAPDQRIPEYPMYVQFRLDMASGWARDIEAMVAVFDAAFDPEKGTGPIDELRARVLSAARSLRGNVETTNA